MNVSYTEFVLRNITIRVREEVARWARLKAVEENTSVSKLVGRMMEREMRHSDRYWRAYQGIRRIRPIPGFDASKRSSRTEIYDRLH